MPVFEYELTTPFSVSKKDALGLIQDPKRFMIAGGSAEEDSMHYDEAAGKWEGVTKASIPMLPKPKFSGTYDKEPDGSHWVVETGMGIKLEHTWTIKEESAELCFATEKVKVQCPWVVYHALKWQLPQTQKQTHKNLQEYLS